MKHALLSASGASRWLNCTPSPRLEQHFPDSTSKYAEEGTLAHELAETELRHSLLGRTCEQHSEARKPLVRHGMYTPAMDEHVAMYCAQVIAAATPGAFVAVEERVDFSHAVPGGFGTVDALVLDPASTTLRIFDLKYGKGVEVSAERNPQLMLYAAGAARKFELSYAVERIVLTIVQPRLNAVSVWELSASELADWLENTVRPAAKLADEGEGKLCPGEWCRWCRVAPRCRPLKDMHMRVAEAGLLPPGMLSDSEVLEVYKQSGSIASWLKDVEAHVLAEALGGKAWPGYKVVAGRSNRKWADEEQAIARLEEQGIPLDIATTRKVIGIPAAEKLLGSDFKAVEDLVVKPEGAPTLVPESDKRPPLGKSVDEVFGLT